MKICPQCQLEYDDKFSFCKQCGQKLEVVQVQRPQGVQKVSSNVVVENSAKDNSDSKKWIFIVCGIVIVALIAFFISKDDTNDNSAINKSGQTINSQNTAEPINNGISKKNVKEEVEKEARAAADINAQKNQSMINNNASVPYESNTVTVNAPGYILGDDVNVRTEPTINSDVIGVVQRGFRFHILSYINDWAKVKSGDGRIGYVNRKYISTNGSDVDWSKGDKYGKHAYSGVVKATDVNMRSSNSINSPVVGRFRQGENVEILGFYKEWVKVKRSNGQIGYIMRSYLKY